MSPADKLEDNKRVTIDKAVKTFLETHREIGRRCYVA